jgi:thiosulfate reductase cytochrome b subunit
MTTPVWILMAAALLYGFYRLARRRTRRQADAQAGVDKKARLARSDAQAIQRSLNGRR